MTKQPQPSIRRAAVDLRRAGASLIAGHFVDDYAADDVLRSDLGLLWLLTVGDSAPPVVEAVPLHLGYCHTTVARDEDANWIRARLGRACHELGTEVTERRDPLSSACRKPPRR